MDELRASTAPVAHPRRRSDEELLVEYRMTGDAELFATLVQRYETELYGYLRRFLGNTEMAEDAFQGTFLQVHLKCDQFKEGRKVRPWLYTIATNQAIDIQRRNRRHRLASLDQRHPGSEGDLGPLLDYLASGEPSPLARAEEQEQRQWIHGQLAHLPETLRQALILVYFQGLKYREAAEVLSVPVGTVKSRMHSAIVKLNEAWYRTSLQGAD